MFKKIKKNLLVSLSSIAGLVALLGVSANSIYTFYEPDVPECLKK